MPIHTTIWKIKTVQEGSDGKLRYRLYCAEKLETHYAVAVLNTIPTPDPIPLGKCQGRATLHLNEYGEVTVLEWLDQ